MALLEVRDLKVTFGRGAAITEALNGVSFDIFENEIVGLVGESGSGKTIAGYSIMGLLPEEARIEGGSVKFKGMEIIGLPDKKMQNIRGKKIAMVFQEPFTSLNPVLNIGCQVREALLAHKNISKDTAEEETIKLLEKVKIKNSGRIILDYPHQLSGGERQRVMIAMAIAAGPDLLICDEPTTALDVTIQKEILDLILELKKEMRLSVLFITHDFSIIDKMADRVIVMRNGRIVEAGRKTHILSAPANFYTKRLLEAVPKIGKSTEYRAQSTELFIETKNLCKSFPVERGFLRKEVSRVYAVQDVSLKIDKGKTMGLVGESGSGKSTLGRMLLGLEKPDSGKVFIKGEKEIPFKARKALQIVFQDPFGSLDPRMKMADIVLEGFYLAGGGKKEAGPLLKNLLEKTQLSFNDRLKYPHQFSGGERQRIAIARALAVSPQFLVLDEPVSSLDVLIQKDILDLLKALKDQFNLTYLFISHDLRVVASMSDEVSVMRDGRIVESGLKDDVYLNPKHPYTKRLLESVL